MSQMTDELMEKVTALVKEGNARRVRLKKDEKVLFDITLTTGVAGAAIGLLAAPWLTVVAAAAAAGTDCVLEIEDKEGNVKSFSRKRPEAPVTEEKDEEPID